MMTWAWTSLVCFTSNILFPQLDPFMARHNYLTHCTISIYVDFQLFLVVVFTCSVMITYTYFLPLTVFSTICKGLSASSLVSCVRGRETLERLEKNCRKHKYVLCCLFCREGVVIACYCIMGFLSGGKYYAMR